MKGNSIFFYSKPGELIKGSVTIENKKEVSRKISTFLNGDLEEKKMIKIYPEEFILKSKEKQAITIEIAVPVNSTGNYTANLSIMSR
jgi:hypothetical protein